MSYTYQYTGTPYTNFEGGGFSSANHITVTIKSPTALPPGLGMGDGLPNGATISMGDGSRNYEDLSPGENPASPPFEGGVTLSVQLSTDSTGRIVAWEIKLDDSTFVDGIPHSTSFGIDTSNVAPNTPLDESTVSIDPGPTVGRGFTNVPGEWINE